MCSLACGRGLYLLQGLLDGAIVSMCQSLISAYYTLYVTPADITETYGKAVIGLENAEGYLEGKAGHTPIGTVAREAVQMAEDSRIITVKKLEEEQLANERQAGVDREARAESGRAAAQSETERVAREAEGARVAAQHEAERVRREHDTQLAAAQVEFDRLKGESDARIVAAQAETDRARQEKETLAATAQAQADRLKRENDVQIATPRPRLIA